MLRGKTKDMSRDLGIILCGKQKSADVIPKAVRSLRDFRLGCNLIRVIF